MSEHTNRELVAGQWSFERWRASRERGTRIPERLWSRAVGLAERHGVSKTAIALGLDYYSLQSRLPTTAETSGGFLELRGAQLGAAPKAARDVGGVVIEVRHPDGAELTVRVGEHAEVDIGELCERLLGGRR